MPANEALKLHLMSLRLDRWPRSLAILPGTAAAFLLAPAPPARGEWPGILLGTLLAFLFTWAISTANYIINEITDAPYDAFHPGKNKRPLVQKKIGIFWLVVIGGTLVTVTLGLALLLYSPRLCLALSLLLLAGIFYNLPPIRLKDIPYLDSTAESANNPIRFMIGWTVFQPGLPPVSLLLAWWLFGNFLMVGKRVAEKKFLADAAAARYRRSLQSYDLRGLVSFMIGSAVLFLLCFAWFARAFHLRVLLWSLPLIVLYLVYFIVKAVKDRDAAEEPEKMLKNPYFALYTLVLMGLFLLAFLWR